MGSCLLIFMGLEKEWFMQEFPFRLIPTLPALLRGLEWVCSEDVCSALCSAPPGYPSLGRELQPAHPFPKRPHQILWRGSGFNSHKPPWGSTTAGSREKQRKYFLCFPMHCFFFFFLTFTGWKRLYWTFLRSSWLELSLSYAVCEGSKWELLRDREVLFNFSGSVEASMQDVLHGCDFSAWHSHQCLVKETLWNLMVLLPSVSSW